MKFPTRVIFLFVLVLVFVAAGAPDGLAPEHPPDTIDINSVNKYFRSSALTGERVPSSLLYRARMYFEGSRGDKDIKQAENWLRVLALQLNQEDLGKNMYFMSENRWNAGFRMDFEKALTWKNSLGDRTLEDVYRLAKSYLALAETQATQEKKDGYRVLGEHIRAVAAASGHSQSRSDLIGADMYKIDASWREIGKKFLWSIAHHENYAPAQLELANNYLFDSYFTHSRLKAFYWFLRAQANNAGDERNIQYQARKLSRAERKRAAEWITRGQALGL